MTRIEDDEKKMQIIKTPSPGARLVELLKNHSWNDAVRILREEGEAARDPR